VRALVGTRGVTASTEHIRALADSGRCEKYFSANCVARALLRTNKPKGNPMISVFRDVAKQRRCIVHIVQHHVNMTVIK
jgi:hypothetical protein